MAKQKDTPPEFNLLKRLIKNKYSPSVSYAKADLHITTVDLFDNLKQSFPGVIDNHSTLINLMNELGFHQDAPGNLQFVWLLNSIDSDRITWLGHASFLIKTTGVTILTDPFLSKYARKTK